MSNEPKASPETSIVTMWVLLEGKPSPVEVDVNPSEYSSGRLTLDRLKPILKEEFGELRDVGKSDIIFFNNDDRTTPLDSGEILTNDTTTSKSPLVVRYPLSNTSIKVNLRLIQNKDECEIPHSSGSFTLLRQAVKEKFNKLEKTEINDIHFEYFQGNAKKGKMIENEFHFNMLVNNIEPNNKKERTINYLKVQVKGKKAYGDWKINEVAKIYDDAFTSVETIPKFKIDSLPEPSPPLESNELEDFVNQLKKKCYAFQAITSNEATAREFISIFLTYAVNYVRKYKDQTTRLAVEVELDGSRGYGDLDYAVFIQLFYALVTEAKMTEMKKGLVQNLVQVHSVVEDIIQKLGKRKREQTDFEDFENSPTVYGIVTTGVLWRFVRWTGPLGSQKIEISEEFNCGLNESFNEEKDTQKVKEVLSYIVRVLQAQAEAIGRGAKRQKNN